MLYIANFIYLLEPVLLLTQQTTAADRHFNIL